MPKVLTQTKHFQMTKQLRKIASNLQPGNEMPTAAELKGMTGASHGTIIRALNSLNAEQVLIRPAGKKRYIVNELVTPPLMRLQMLTHNYNSSVSDTFQDSLNLICKKRNWLFDVDVYHDQESLDINIARENADAIILLPSSEEFSENFIRFLKKPQQPIVMLMQHTDISSVGNVAVDDFACGELAVDILADFGHHDILLVKDQPIESTIKAREFGWRKAMHRRFGQVDEDLVFDSCIKSFENARQKTYEKFSRYIAEIDKLPFSAVFTTSIEGAIAVNRVLREAGYDIPGDVSLITYAGEGNLCEFMMPPISNITADLTDYVDNSISLIEEMVQNPSGVGRKILLPITYIQGQTIKQL